jgi:hypothetical protein
MTFLFLCTLLLLLAHVGEGSEKQKQQQPSLTADRGSRDGANTLLHMLMDPSKDKDSGNFNFNFVFSPAHTDAAERRHFKAIKKHACGSMQALLDFQYCNFQPLQQMQQQHQQRPRRPELFSKHVLLSHLRGKNMVIMGDSMGLQLFYSLDASLHSERTSINLTLSRPKNKYHIDRGVATYQHHNATLQYLLAPTVKAALPLLQAGALRRADVLLVAICAWYKPGQIPRPFPPDLARATDIYNSSVHELRAAIASASAAAAAASAGAAAGAGAAAAVDHTPVRVIWQLSPHAGPANEDRFKHLLGTTTSGSGKLQPPNASFWDQFPHEAEWVAGFNSVLRGVARGRGDRVLDLHSVSAQLLGAAQTLRTSLLAEEKEEGGDSGGGSAVLRALLNNASHCLLPDLSSSPSPSSPSSSSEHRDRDSDGDSDGDRDRDSAVTPQQEVRAPAAYTALTVHSDSLHYCQGGLFRAAGLALQTLLGRLA